MVEKSSDSIEKQRSTDWESENVRFYIEADRQNDFWSVISTVTLTVQKGMIEQTIILRNRQSEEYFRFQFHEPAEILQANYRVTTNVMDVELWSVL